MIQQHVSSAQAPDSAPQRVAIVTTLRNAEAVLDSFLRYHTRIGFDHFFLFFDNPADPSLANAARHANVSAIPTDDALRERWKATRYARQRDGPVDAREVMARQILNVEVALELARERGIDWLLHIDADELFYAAGASVQEHFRVLAARGVAKVTYLNHEVVPERTDVADFFREATLFKRNTALWNDLRLRSEDQALLASTPQIPPAFFHFYSNGKAAARVGAAPWMTSVHDFAVPDGSIVAKARTRPVVLHYPCCGFGHFWTKYTTLGSFPDRWFGEIDIRASIGTFHLDARDVVATGDAAAARAFYESRMVIDRRDLADRLVEAGVFMRIEEPARMLSNEPPVGADRPR